MPKSPLKLVYEPSDKGVLGPARPVVIREPDSRRIQPLPDVQGKGKEKAIDEQATHDVLTLQNPKKKSPANKFIFQRRTPMPTEAFGHAESPSLDAELTLTDNEMESDNEVPKINSRNQDEGQAGPNPSNQDEGQARSNPGDAAESQPQSSHVVPAGPNLEHMDLEATDALTQQKLKQMDEEFTTTAYPNVHENLKLPTEDQFFLEKPQEEELGKTNAEAEVQSIVLDLIYQDTSSVPLMTTPVIDLTKSQSDSLLPTSIATISTITTTTPTLLPPPPQPQQNTAYPILVKHIVDWAMQDPLRARFRDLPIVDMKEILQQRMFKDNSFKAQDVQNNLYEALQKSLELDYSNQCLTNQEEARASGAPGTSGASGFSQLSPPPPYPSTGTSGSAQQQGIGISRAQELSLTDSLMQDDSIPDEQVHLSDNEDSENDHLPKADLRKDWWKPLPEEERPATPEPAWFIPSSNVSAIENNWASAWFQLMNLLLRTQYLQRLET
ncbi:hypothetical protein Tco_0756318 [Tanacetum coccineum]